MEYNDLILDLEDAITDSIVSNSMEIESDLLHKNFRKVLKRHLESVVELDPRKANKIPPKNPSPATQRYTT
tara:strand:+ start:424 stop:636 length:213 start_codon:yes stop_codon:yes gene_type:complete